ncbi:unnamed protein product [Caenorhabditis bovis]|uniref:Uncharacterized protein n=1 Tax=Caenorhabditis bovis TaxID=2654633 RepID=A0A8S1FEY9_9PELO|nr:unnamed protein product [Caenorhabditis bovis]
MDRQTLVGWNEGGTETDVLDPIFERNRPPSGNSSVAFRCTCQRCPLLSHSIFHIVSRTYMCSGWVLFGCVTFETRPANRAAHSKAFCRCNDGIWLHHELHFDELLNQTPTINITIVVIVRILCSDLRTCGGTQQVPKWIPQKVFVLTPRLPGRSPTSSTCCNCENTEYGKP